MNRLLAPLPALLLLTVSPAVAQEETSAGLSFGWELPSRATVTQLGEKKGQRIEIRYRIELSEADDELRLSTDALELLAVNGQDLTAPAMRPLAAQQAAQLQAAFPRLRIARTGELLGVEDWEAHVERSIAALRQVAPQAKRDGLEATRRMMLDPRYRAQLELKSGEHWQVWVMAWLGGEIGPGEVQEGITEIPVGETLLDARLTLSHEGTSDEGYVRLRMETVLEGDEAKAAMRQLMLDLTRDGPRPLPEDLEISEFSRRTVLTVTTDPRTLRPLEASSEATSRVGVSGEGPAKEERERRHYTFAWE